MFEKPDTRIIHRPGECSDMCSVVGHYILEELLELPKPRYHRYQDPATKVNRVVVSNTEDEPDRSYLGRWEDSGWSIMIEPKLTKEEWGEYARHGAKTWNPTIEDWDVNIAMTLLKLLFPRHTLTILIPKPIKKKKEQ